MTKEFELFVDILNHPYNYNDEAEEDVEQARINYEQYPLKTVLLDIYEYIYGPNEVKNPQMDSPLCDIFALHGKKVYAITRLFGLLESFHNNDDYYSEEEDDGTESCMEKDI